MERKAIVICSIVGFLGLLSAGLGFAAEAKRVKASQMEFIFPDTCRNPGSASFGLAIIAVVAILVAQIIITTTTGCLCCRPYSYQSNFKRALAVICYSISWVTFVIAFVIFIRGATLNGPQSHPDVINTQLLDVCYFLILKPGVFAGASFLALATAVLGIFTYLAWDSAKNTDNPWGGDAASPNQGVIAMAHPQFPPPQYSPPQYPPSNKQPSAPVF